MKRRDFLKDKPMITIFSILVCFFLLVLLYGYCGFISPDSDTKIRNIYKKHNSSSVLCKSFSINHPGKTEYLSEAISGWMIRENIKSENILSIKQTKLESGWGWIVVTIFYKPTKLEESK